MELTNISNHYVFISTWLKIYNSTHMTLQSNQLESISQHRNEHIAIQITPKYTQLTLS